LIASQRELAQLAQASNFSTRKAKGAALDFAQLSRDDSSLLPQCGWSQQ
jgi:hypothetical protein